MDVVEAIAKFLRDNWQGTMGAGMGTFGGAYFAFLFERKHAAKKERSMNLASLRKAQFALFSMFNCALSIKNQALDPKRDDEHRYASMPPLHVFSKTVPIDLGSVSFILEGDRAQMLSEMMIAEESFNTFLSVLSERSACHLLVQSIIAKHGADAVGKDIEAKIKNLTDSTFEMNSESIGKTKAAFDAIGVYIKTKYPKEKALRFEINSKYAE